MNPKSLAICIGGAVLVVLALEGLLGSAPRALVAVPLVLVLPGLALTALLFPSRVLGLLERSLFSVGMSLTITILAGLVLNWTPWGLAALPACLAIFTVVVGWIGLRQERGNPLAAARGWRRVFGATPVLPMLLAGCAVVVLGITAGIATQSDARQSGTGFTQLWILQNTLHGARAADIGITNNEQFTTLYTLRLAAAGHTLKTWQSLRLAAGHTWQTTIVLPATALLTGRTEVTLYRAAYPRIVYRRAWLR